MTVDFASLGVWIGTLAGCFVSGLFPIVNAEALLLAVSALVPPAALPPLVLLAALGQTSAKLLMCLAGRGVLSLPLDRARRHLDAIRARLERSTRQRDALIFCSASVGLPPLYVVSVAAGALRVPLPRFAALTFIGRLLRFAFVMALPQLIKSL